MQDHDGAEDVRDDNRNGEEQEVAGERGIPPVNGHSSEGAQRLKRGLAIAGMGLVALVVLFIYLPFGKSNAQADAEKKSESQRQLKGEAKKSLPPERPTVAKLQADAKAKLRAVQASVYDDYTILPPLGAADVDDDAQSSANGRPELAAPVERSSRVGGDRAAERAAQEAADLAERRQRAPLIAYGGRRVDPRRTGRAEEGTAEASSDASESSLDRATKAVLKTLERGSAGTGGGNGGDVTTPRAAGAADGGKGELSQKITPTTVALVSAASLPNRDLLITQGTFINCTLETALDSTIAGFTRCVTTQNIYSNNGRVVLMERGTKLIGQYQGGVKQGQSRIFVLWTRAETPRGVVIQLDSPGTDALGGSGLPGEVDNKFLARFGGALLLSILNDGFDVLKAGVADNANFPAANTEKTGQDIANTALEATVNIPPILYKNPGNEINITIARDLDFSGVYSLRLASPVGAAAR
jgi:type IV secretory pathway VirB10-like protein